MKKNIIKLFIILFCIGLGSYIYFYVNAKETETDTKTEVSEGLNEFVENGQVYIYEESTDANTLEHYADYTDLVVFEFKTDWCPYCLQLENDMYSILKDNPKLSMIQIDIESNKEYSKKYEVLATPTLYFIYKGEVMYTLNGYPGKEGLLKVLSEITNQSNVKQ